MKSKLHHRQWLWAAAAAALPVALWALPASAQYQVGNGGHERDANPGLNSGGFNGNLNLQNQPIQPGLMGQSIVQNNVTGGRGFTGPLPSGEDPRAFRGSVPTAGLDNFVAGSTGIPQANSSAPLPNTSTQFYPVSRFVPPPANFIAAPNNAGFVPAPAGAELRQQGDLRMGSIGLPPQVPLVAPGQFNLPGQQVDPGVGVPSAVPQSAAYGFHTFGQATTLDQTLDARFDPMHIDDALDTGKLDAQTVQRLRQELAASPAEQPPSVQTPAGQQITQPGNGTNGNGTGGNGLGGNGLGGNGTGGNGTGGNGTGGNGVNGTPGAGMQPQSLLNVGAPPINGQMQQPFETPSSGQLQTQATNAALSGGIPGNLNTQAGVSTRSLLAPRLQSSQYDELTKRLQRYYTSAQLEEQTRAQAIKDQNLTRTAKAATDNNPGGPSIVPTPTPVAIPPSRTAEEILKDHTPAATSRPEPLNIKSLADGMKAKGLSDMLKAAETLTREGKYAAAIDSYEAAEQVVPNNPLILIGRANAELGASYFGRADSHLKMAFAADKALLMAKFDLKSFLGEQRLTSVIKELKDVAASDDKSPAAPFLLAYIAYNTGSERKAAGYLDLAEKRSGGKDPMLKVIREHWGLDVFGSETPAKTK